MYPYNVTVRSYIRFLVLAHSSCTITTSTVASAQRLHRVEKLVTQVYITILCDYTLVSNFSNHTKTMLHTRHPLLMNDNNNIIILTFDCKFQTSSTSLISAPWTSKRLTTSQRLSEGGSLALL